MNCLCGKKAVYNQRFSGQKFCRTCFTRYFERKVIHTIRKYNMIKNGEKIAVGISGGKDSTTLLHILSKYPEKLGVTIHPLLVDEGIKHYRADGIQAAEKTCEKLKLNLHIKSFQEETGLTLDRIQERGELKPCTYCGVIRRKILNQSAKELGAEKLAVGHNLDDEAQVVMMNYISGDIERLHRLAGETKSTQLVKRIKPLSRIPEKEVMLYTLINDLETSHFECPYADENHRTRVREFLNGLEKERPGIKFSIISGWEKIVETSSTKSKEMNNCITCNQITTRELCRACELTQEIKIKMSGES